MEQAEPKTKTSLQLFYPTEQKRRCLEEIARHEIVNIGQLTTLLYGTIQDEDERHIAHVSINRTLRSLMRHGMVHTRHYRPLNFKGKGKYPRAFWLSEQGHFWANDHCPETDPKHHGADRAELNILHDLRRTDVRMALYQFKDEHHLTIGQKKSDLFHYVKPDDLYEFTREKDEFTKEKTTRFFMELERHPKDFRPLHEKLQSYVEYRKTKAFKDAWGFSNFNVLIPMRSERSMLNLIVHFGGGCNCAEKKLQQMHANKKWLLDSDILWVTTYDAFLKNPGGKIFFSPDKRSHSLLDIIQ